MSSAGSYRLCSKKMRRNRWADEQAGKPTGSTLQADKRMQQISRQACLQRAEQPADMQSESLIGTCHLHHPSIKACGYLGLMPHHMDAYCAVMTAIKNVMPGGAPRYIFHCSRMIVHCHIEPVWGPPAAPMACAKGLRIPTHPMVDLRPPRQSAFSLHYQIQIRCCVFPTYSQDKFSKT